MMYHKWEENKVLRSKDILADVCRNTFFKEGIAKLFNSEYNYAIKELASHHGDQNSLYKKLGEVQYLHTLVKEIESYGDD